MIRKLLFAFPALALGLVALVGTGTGAQAASTVTVRAGDGETGYSVNEFLSGPVYIQPGDTVKWEFRWLEPHTVTFGVPAGDPTAPTGGSNPSWEGTGFISSGFPSGPGFTYSVTFPKKGSYDYFCAIHPGMTSTVVVRTPDLGPPDTQASINQRSDAEYKTDIGTLKAAAAATAATAGAVTPKTGGGKKYSVSISTTNDVPVGDVQQFFPANLNIAVNDEVEWTNNTHTPHTVTIVPPGFDPSGPPPPGAETFDPFESSLFVPADHKFPNVQGFLSTQVMGQGWPGGTTFALTFTKAGSYTYLCILHADQGMQAKVNVGAQGAPGAPNTGDSAGSHKSSDGLWIIGGAAVMLLLATSGAFAVTRR